MIKIVKINIKIWFLMCGNTTYTYGFLCAATANLTNPLLMLSVFYAGPQNFVSSPISLLGPSRLLV